SGDISTMNVGNILIENLDAGYPGAEKVSNEHSIVLKVSLGDYSFLMTGDMTEAMEEYMLGHMRDLQVDVLKLAHHGSDTSTGGAIVEAASPAYALISAGA